MPYSEGAVRGQRGDRAIDEESLQPTKLLFHLSNLGPRARIGLCHLPLTLVLVVLAFGIPSLWSTLDRPAVQWGITCYAVLIASCWIVPWERLPAGAPLLIPLGDLVAIGLFHHGISDILDGLSVLAVFPVIWLSVSGMFPWVAAAVSFAGPLIIVRAGTPAPLPTTDVQLTSSFLLPVMLLAVSLAIRSVAGNVAQQQRQIAKKDKELRALLFSSHERERLLQTILDTVDIGIVAVDADGNTTLTNEHMRQLEGPAPVAPAQTAEPGWLLRAQDRKTVLLPGKRPVQRAVDGEEFSDYVVWAGDLGVQRAFSTAARSLRTKDGGFGGAVVAFSDVTSLYEAVLAKDDLVANVSHDLRSPLTSILGNLDLVIEDLDANGEAPLRSVGQYLRYSHQSAERLLDLVSDLVLSAAAATSVHPRPADLAGLIDSCVGALRPRASATGVSLITRVPAPLAVYADPVRIAQVLDNLVANAIKYSPDGGDVVISAESDGLTTTVEVRDTGLGMSAQDTVRAFDKFFRSEATRESAIPGTGLGLSIVKDIVDRHDGSIHCTSSLGEGTSMRIDLPAGPAST